MTDKNKGYFCKTMIHKDRTYETARNVKNEVQRTSIDLTGAPKEQRMAELNNSPDTTTTTHTLKKPVLLNNARELYY